MTTQSLDLVHELQVELGWTPDFAATAHSEYMRWLRLRAQSGDFQYCKLPPSRVVALVWSLHRQWTMDYENTCSGLGGFIHHYPPAMRMNIPREQAYAATLHTYKTMFKEDPPSSHWGAAICPYKPLTSSSGFAVGNHGVPDPPPRALPSLRRSPAKRDTSLLSAPTTPTKQKARTAGDSASRRNAAGVSIMTAAASDKSRSASDAARPYRRNSKSGKDDKNLMEGEEETVLDGDDQSIRSPGRPRKKFSGPSALYMLKPLRPGEKRKRGRPSFSDYVLASNMNQVATAGDLKKKDAKNVSDKAATGKSGGPTLSLRRRKSVASPSKTPAAAPTIVKKEKGHKPFRRVARSSASSTIADAKNTGTNLVVGTANAAAKQTQPRQDTRDGAAPVKRPRGRPRKDGSWPIPRARKTEAASKPAAPVAQKPTAATITAEKPKEGGAELPKVVPAKSSESAVETSNALPVPSSSALPIQTSSGFPPGTGTGLPAPTPSGTAPMTSNGTAAPISASLAVPVPTSMSAPMPSPVESAVQRKQVNPLESVMGQSAMENVVPSKIIEARDLQMHDLTDKEVPKPHPLPEGMPRDGVFEQIIDGSGLVEKDRPVDMSIPLGSKDVRMGQDVVFPQSETMRDAPDLDMSLGAVSRPENVSNIPGAPVQISSHGHQGGEKLMPQANTFSMGPVNVSSVSNALDGGMLQMGTTSVPLKPTLDGDKDGDMEMEDGDSKKPFKRPRGRPRKDGSWPVARAKPMNEEAVERVKDLSDPSLNFSIGPSGTV